MLPLNSFSFVLFGLQAYEGRVSDPPGLKLQLVLSCTVSAWNLTQVLGRAVLLRRFWGVKLRSSHWRRMLYPLSHPQSLVIGFLASTIP